MEKEDVKKSVHILQTPLFIVAKWNRKGWCNVKMNKEKCVDAYICKPWCTSTLTLCINECDVYAVLVNWPTDQCRHRWTIMLIYTLTADISIRISFDMTQI